MPASTATEPVNYGFAHHQSGTSMLGLTVAQLVIGGTWLAVFLVGIVTAGATGLVFGLLAGIPTPAVMFLRVGYRPCTSGFRSASGG